MAKAVERGPEKFIRRALLTLGLLAVASSTFWVARGYMANLSTELYKTRILVGDAREEKDTALDLVSARDREIKQLKAKLKQAVETLDAKDRMIEKRNQQIQDNRRAAEALGEVINKEREEKEQLKKNIKDTIKPHVDNCNKALKDKNDAIAALVMERDSNDRLATNIDKEIERREKEITSLKQQLEGKEGEIMRIRMEHQEIHKEHVQKESHAANIWKATVQDAGSTCPEPLLHLSEGFQLGDMLGNERRRVGVELGFQDANFTRAVLSRWEGMTSYFIVEPPSGPSIHAIRNMTAENIRIRLVIHEDLGSAMKEFSPYSVDYLHISVRVLTTRESVKKVLELSWDKLRPGGLITGGFPCPGTVVQAEQQQIQEVKWAVAEFSKIKNRQASFALEPNSMAWMIRR